jgi:hypothetical protein
MLNKYAGEISEARCYADIADRIRRETRAMLVDLFGTEMQPSSAAYHVDIGQHRGSILCLDLAVRYEPDVAKLASVLGDRLQNVTETKPVFDRKKAEAAIKAGVVTEAEMARCVRAVPRTIAVLRDAADGRAPKGIEAGEARVTPLKLSKGVKLDWGEKE